MKRSVGLVVAAVLLATVALVGLASPAGAKGKPVKVVLNCGDSVSSISVTVQMKTGGLFGSNVGAPISVTCVTSGIQSTTAKDAPKADAYTYSYTYPASTGCSGGGGGFGNNARGTPSDLIDCNPAVIGTLSVD